MQKQLCIFKHFAKSYVFTNTISIILPLISIKFETLNPPSVYTVPVLIHIGVITNYFLRELSHHNCRMQIGETDGARNAI
jgi:hypothetical protein